jgi:hypothetical protein
MTPYNTSTLTEHPPYNTYRVWSRQERRWVSLTFDEYQAWLTRPDLDPAEFDSGEVAS